MIVAPRQIEGVIVSLPALTEGPTVMDPDTVTPVQVFEAVPAAITVNVSTCALAFWYYIYMEHTKLRCSYSLYRITTVFRFLIICLVGCLDLSLPQTQFCIFVMMRCSHTTVSWYLLEYSVGYQGVSSFIQVSNTRMWRLHVRNTTGIRAGRYGLIHLLNLLLLVFF